MKLGASTTDGMRVVRREARLLRAARTSSVDRPAAAFLDGASGGPLGTMARSARALGTERSGNHAFGWSLRRSLSSIPSSFPPPDATHSPLSVRPLSSSAAAAAAAASSSISLFVQEPNPQQLLRSSRLDGTVFRRTLPEPSFELSSPKGVETFAQALGAGTAQCFFRLIEQLHTQNEPEWCGLASLATVLNALNVDPHRRWKGIWRYYSEDLLDCCESTSNVKRSGIDFDKLAGLARCNGLEVRAERASDFTEDYFRQRVLEASRIPGGASAMMLAYSRKLLNQTGSGHYSPMGAYHEASDHLLILDCARFKYRVHWTPLPVMYEAMRSIDTDTGKSRGFMMLTPTAASTLAVPPPASTRVLSVTMKAPLLARNWEPVLLEVADAAPSPAAAVHAVVSSLEREVFVSSSAVKNACDPPNAAASTVVCASTSRRNLLRQALIASPAAKLLGVQELSELNLARIVLAMSLSTEFWRRAAHVRQITRGVTPSPELDSEWKGILKSLSTESLGPDVAGELEACRADLDSMSVKLSTPPPSPPTSPSVATASAA